MIARIFVFMAALLTAQMPVDAVGQSAPTQGTVDAATLAEKLLAAMGGHESWAAVVGLKVDATHHQTDVAAPYSNQIWNDFAEPRVRFEAKNDTIHSIITIEGGKGSRQRDGGARTELTAERVADETAWWSANVYRTLHRLAVRDGTLTARLGKDGRLEFVASGGQVLNWFRLNQAGEPVQFGTSDGPAGSVFGPLANGPNGIKYPRWGANQDGSFRYEVTAVRAYTTQPEFP